MGSKYTSQSASGYNSSPPPDDGSQSASNLVKWSTHKTKLADPIKTLADAINTAVVTAMDYSVRQITSSDTVVASDHMKTVEFAPAATSGLTLSLGDAATMTDNFIVRVKNSSTHEQTISRATTSDTIDGSAADIKIPPKAAFVFSSTSAADGYLVISGYDSTPAGVIMDYGGSTAPVGWLECDGSAVSRTTYANLFTAIGTTWGTGNGSTTFNLPDFRGRARIGKGTGTATESGVNADVDTTADTLTVASNNTKWITGMPVTFTLASGTITGLTSGATYYVIRASSTTIKLASSLANAQGGTAIDLTAKSSPVWTITYSMTARTLAEGGGEEGHAQSSTELYRHQHTGEGLTAGAGSQGPGAGSVDFASMSFEGGNAAMNIMQPYAVTMAIIKY